MGRATAPHAVSFRSREEDRPSAPAHYEDRIWPCSVDPRTYRGGPVRGKSSRASIAALSTASRRFRSFTLLKPSAGTAGKRDYFSSVVTEVILQRIQLLLPMGEAMLSM